MERVNIDQECSVTVDGDNEHAEFWKNVGKLMLEGFEEGLKGNTETSTPNPIYIPKHVQHRRKGRK